MTKGSDLDTMNEEGEHKPAGGQISRRKFLKILGASSALGVAGCADSAEQKIFPYVKGEVEQIPGVSVWYNSTCTECSAACGIQVRTREGRAVKVEGNPNSPINRGGLCALGQASLQSLYDPDRVRQPLKRRSIPGGRYAYDPVSWDEAYAAITQAMSDNKSKKRLLLTGETSGALEELITQWCNDHSGEHIVFDALQATALAKASELVYGVYGIPHYSFDKAEAIVNFGADFLETWVSPVEFARDWAKSRKTENPARFVHIEPRASLTAASADVFLSCAPESEVYVAKAILKELLESGRGKNLSDDVLSGLKSLVGDVDTEVAASNSGIPREKILLVVDYLKSAKNSLVIAGGAATATDDPLTLHVLVHFINSVLENVGTTVRLNGMRKPKTSLAKLTQAIQSMREGQVGVLLMHGTNPEFTLPTESGFGYASKNVPLVVSFSSHLDETAKLAHYILPAHTGLESWGDARPYEGCASLLQPSMTPVFDTRMLGDMLLEIASQAGKPITRKSGGDGTVKDFQAYLQASWKDLHQASGVSQDFKTFWAESLERGGYFAENSGSSVKVKVNREIFTSKSDRVSDHKVAHDELVLLTYPSVKTFDGRAANRPWLQELADPMTQVVWDTWAELHPETAVKFGLDKGDLVTLRNSLGEVEVPVYISPYVHRGVVAMPLGQGHSAYGRFAEQVGGGSSPLSLVSYKVPEGGGNVPLMGARVKVLRARGQAHMVNVQGSDSQLGRELARTTFVNGAAAAAVAEAEHSHGHAAEAESHGEGHHVPKQMYVQRQHPLYEWGMIVDLAACTGCSACVVACYAENNIPVVGKKACSKGREMTWLRIERYHDGAAEELQVSFLPMMCQHCHNAPCEPVCPVYATYHNEEGLNAMVYNRCVGTRYCSNNCSYKVRRFNWYEYEVPEPLSWQLNPDVVKRASGVMEKCTFCVQRIMEAKDKAKDLGRLVEDGEIKPACVQGCPTQALTFGNLKDPNSRVSKLSKHARAYKVLDHHLNTQPAVTYLERVKREV